MYKNIFWIVETVLWTFLPVQPSILYRSLQPTPALLGTSSPSVSGRNGSGEADSTHNVNVGAPDLDLSQSVQHNDPFWLGPDTTEALFIIGKTSSGSYGRFRGPETWDHLRAEAADTMFLSHDSEGRNEKNGI